MNLHGFYKKLRIKHQVLAILLVILLALFLLSFGVLQYSFGIYDNLLYKQSSNVLNLSAKNVENELKKIELMAFEMMTNDTIQKRIDNYLFHSFSYERLQDSQEINQILLKQVRKEKYISSMMILDPEGKKISIVADYFDLSDDYLKEIMALAEEKTGANVWVEPDQSHKDLLAVRQIRKAANGELSPLGFLVLTINMDTLIQQSSGNNSNQHSHMIIGAGSNMIYSTLKKDGYDGLSLLNQDNSTYKVQTINNEKYFVSYYPSSYNGWNYVGLIPYEGIFKGVNVVRRGLFAIFMVAWVIISIVSLRYTRGITMPIEVLSKQMKDMETGTFKLDELLDVPEDSKNEIYSLYKDFFVMTQKIDTLINENYIKQIALKESDLKLLQSQINPHFLYNTLESINWMAKASNQKEISGMVRALGNLLRNSISNREYFITIGEEIKILNDYILIQKTRYEERLDFHMGIGEELYDYKIPRLSFQPIVENAIHYALEKIPEICRIEIHGMLVDDMVEIVISDNGPGMDTNVIEGLNKGEIKPNGLGVGLRNVDTRIKIACGEQYGVSVESEKGKGSSIIIRIPAEYNKAVFAAV